MKAHVRIAAALVVALAVVASVRPAGAALISAVRVDPALNGGARIVLSVAGPLPQYRVAGTGSSEISIDLAQTQTALNLPSAISGTGPVLGVRFAGFGTIEHVTIQLVAPVPVRVTNDGRNIYIDVAAAPLSSSRAPRSAVTQSAAVPAVPEVVEIIPLKYADLSEVVGVLVEGQSIAPNDTFAPQPSQLGQLSNNFGGTFNGAVGPQVSGAIPNFGNVGQPAQSMGQRINGEIAIDRRLNAIILTGTQSRVAALHALIDKLDVPLRSVVLETQIVELTDSAAKSIGIDYTAGGGPIASVKATIASQAFPNGSATLQAAIYDVVSRGGGRLIARPRIVAQNGSSASILTGDAIPIITNITSFGSATVTQQQVQYVSVGVNLQIQPRITSDGFVTSHIFSEVSSVTGYVQTFPQISQRVATTQATVRDGEAFVIGGLIQENELRNLDKIPGLGSLPIIGGFFRNRHESRSSTNLYIVVTPHIVQPGGMPPPPLPASRPPR